MTNQLGDISQINITLTITNNQTSIRPRIDCPLVRGVIGLGIASGIGFLGWRKGSLSAAGATGAVVSGTLTTARGGYGRAALLVGFFVASSLLSRLPERRDDTSSSYIEKGDRRDAWQVGANGGVSTILACLGSRERYRLPYLGALAAATGDTWATEIGRRWGRNPRHVLTGALVEPGVSGGVTGVGSIATLAGGVFIGTLGAASGLFDPAFRERRRNLLLTGVTAGILGSLVDSIAGATIQERRWCEQCQKSTERKVHWCGETTKIVGGVPGIDNDSVNLICTLTGCTIGVAIERWSRH